MVMDYEWVGIDGDGGGGFGGWCVRGGRCKTILAGERIKAISITRGRYFGGRRDDFTTVTYTWQYYGGRHQPEPSQ